MVDRLIDADVFGRTVRAFVQLADEIVDPQMTVSDGVEQFSGVITTDQLLLGGNDLAQEGSGTFNLQQDNVQQKHQVRRRSFTAMNLFAMNCRPVKRTMAFH